MATTASRRYHVTVQGETFTLEGPPDIVNMYRVVRGAYPAALSLELGSSDDEPRQREDRPAPKKVHWHHGDN